MGWAARRRGADGRREQRLNATGDFDDREEVRELVGLGRFFKVELYDFSPSLLEPHITCHSAR